ncbi:MAG: ornithine cyclodeaminase family protein [Alphaproteobacteria bacterium]|nr:ornithine cyclodeaminase family protein [Alphaproteobacteria bacterium]
MRGAGDTPELLYLSRADIDAIALEPQDVARAIEAMLAAKAAGGTAMVPKTHFRLPDSVPDGAAFFSMPGALADPPVAAVKWIGLAAGNSQRNLPHISGTIVLSDGVTGLPIAIMDGEWVTAARTAGISAVAARHLARPESRTIGFVACGVQARSHLAALRTMLPLERVRAYGHRRPAVDDFVAHARGLGLQAEVATHPADAVEDCDVVVTSVPEAPGLAPFLDPAWIAPGAFVSGVDIGRSWQRSNLRQLDLLVTDDHVQSRALAPSGRSAWSNEFDADLAELVAGIKPGRRTADQRTMLIFSGLALADVAVSAALAARARTRGIGTVLER